MKKPVGDGVINDDATSIAEFAAAVMSLYIPRLRRAVSDFLQLPLQDTTIAFEIIQECLHDARTVNSVYHLLVSQASREPFSPFLVEKSVTFMKRHLHGFPPSLETLTCISQFCLFALKTFGTGALHAQPALERSLHFLQVMVDRLRTDVQALSSSSAQYSDDQPTALKPSTLSSVRSWELGANGIPESENGELNSLGQTSRTASASLVMPAASLGAASNLSSDNLPQLVRRTKTPVGTPVTPARRAESSNRTNSQAAYVNSAGSAPQGDSQTHRRSRSGSLAEQFVQEMLRFRPPLIWMPSGRGSLSALLPFVPAVPPGVDGNRSAADSEDDGWQSATSMRGLMCMDHLWAVADRQNGSHGGESRRGGSNVLSSGPLFQYRNYEQQESLQLKSADIAVLVDTVCPSETNQADSVWGGMDWHDIWHGDGSGSKGIGEACVAILIKLIMDLYLEHGPGVSYVLVLQMLHQALLNADVGARVRVFDLVYNLSLHSLMMCNTPDDAFFEENETETDTEPAYTRRDSRDMSSPERTDGRKLDTLKEEADAGGHFKKTDTEVPMLSMMPWIRTLLFDLMTILEQLDEKDDSVWSAAVACFFHLTSANGEILLSVVHNFPVSVAGQMLRVCIHAGWSDEIYSYLLKILIKLLYLPHTEGYEGRVVNDCRLSQCGGIEEILYHLRTTRSMLDASLLVQLVIDYISYKTSCSPDAMGTMLSHLLSASAMDVIVARCRHGEKGIGDILRVALQNCIIERNANHESPKKPFHHRHISQSSFFSGETTMSLQAGVDPRGLESWTTILTEIDELLCRWTPPTALPSRAQELGNPADATPASWRLVKELATSAVHEDRILGMRWIRDYSLTKVDHVLQQEDRSQMSLLPEPPSLGSEVHADAEEEEQEEGPEGLPWMLHGWVSQADEWTAVEASQFIDELVSRLATHDVSSETTSTSGLDLPAKTIVHRLGIILFRTLHTCLRWIRLLPHASRRRPLLTLGFQVCQIVHAPHVIIDISASPPVDGLSALPGPFVYNDYILGTASIYIRLLRLAPIEFLLDLISDLRQLCPEYQSGIGFHGRPGHRCESKNGIVNVPWTDTVSDIRAALVLLLLHRCSMDSKGKCRLDDLCTELRLDDDARVRYVASRHLLKHMMETKADDCRKALREFVAKAQQINNEQLVDNPYLQVEHIVESQKSTEPTISDRYND